VYNLACNIIQCFRNIITAWQKQASTICTKQLSIACHLIWNTHPCTALLGWALLRIVCTQPSHKLHVSRASPVVDQHRTSTALESGPKVGFRDLELTPSIAKTGRIKRLPSSVQQSWLRLIHPQLAAGRIINCCTVTIVTRKIRGGPLPPRP